jgi:putative transposase
VHDALETEKIKRESRWSQSIAVGEKQFVTKIKKRLGFKAVGRRIKPSGDGFQVREEIRPYISDFDA